MDIFFTHSEVTWFHVHGFFRVTVFSMNLEFSYFPQLWLLEWGCNGLKNVTKGLQDVREGGISARKAGLLWGLSINKSMIMIMIMNLYCTKTVEEYSKALYIKLKLMYK